MINVSDILLENVQIFSINFYASIEIGHSKKRNYYSYFLKVLNINVKVYQVTRFTF